ncbi:MAG TPA: hypothetical protein DIT58_01115, partial [Porticoccaceae bacterium]|nr:hypothetical protein [Porticoccaceae bacterium]
MQVSLHTSTKPALMIRFRVKHLLRLLLTLCLSLVIPGVVASADSENRAADANGLGKEHVVLNQPPEAASAPETPAPEADSKTLAPGSTPDSKGIENQVRTRELEQALKRYRQAIRELDAYGPYHEQSSEALFGLGETLKNHGLYKEAIITLRRAMHINRVNHGLHSLSQAPILESIIETQKALNLFENVTTNYSRLLNLFLKNHDANHPSLIPLLQELALWHISMYQLDSSTSRVDHITSANGLINAALKNAQAAPELDTQAHIELLRITALVNLYASQHEGDQWATALDAPYSASADQEFMSLSRMATLSKTGFKKGRIAHEQIIKLAEMDEDNSPERIITAYVEAGDWYLLFNRRNQAMNYYERAHELITASDQSEMLMAQWFSQPVFLPAVLSVSKPEHLPTRHITAELDISESGRPSQINLLEPSTESGLGLRRSALKTIRQARFRPRFADGKPVETKASRISIP